jgi:hypothetical protein
MGSASDITRLIGALAVACLAAATGARAQDAAVRTLTEETFLNPQSWFKASACGADARSGLHLSLGSSTVRVPVEIVRGIIPGKVSGLTKGADGRTTIQAATNLGCRTAPLSIASAYLLAEQGKHGQLIVSASPTDRSLEQTLAKLRDGGTCPKLEEGLFACEGTRTTARGGRERISYLMAVDPKLVQLSGGPLRAQCLFPPPENKPVCMAIDDLVGGVRYEAVIATAPTLAAITAMHKEARSYVETIRVRGR